MRLGASFLEDLAMRLGVPPHPNPQPTNLDLVERVVFSPLSLSPPLVCSARMLFAFHPVASVLVVIPPLIPLGFQDFRGKLFCGIGFQALDGGGDPIARVRIAQVLQLLQGQEQLELVAVLGQAGFRTLGRFEFAHGSRMAAPSGQM